jgi:hypothetical protein
VPQPSMRIEIALETADSSSVKGAWSGNNRLRSAAVRPDLAAVREEEKPQGSSMKGVTVRLGSALIRDTLKVMADAKAPAVIVRHERERGE